MRHDAHEYFVLAVDHGTSGIKNSLVSMSGHVIDSEYRKTPISFFEGGGAEQDPEDWWRAFIESSRELVKRGAVPTDRIVAICVSSTFSSTVAVGDNGRHLMNAITWMDSRGARHVKNVMGGFPSIEGYAVSNLLRWVPKTAGGPTLGGKDDIAHVLLIKNEYPEIYARTRSFLPSKDYLNLRLTGKTAASFDSMQLFWVTDTRDINNVKYDPKLIKRLGIDAAKLPPLVPSTAILGSILPEVADEIGLGSGVQVICGSPDHQSACIGSGAVQDFHAHLYVGTSSWLQCVVPFKKTDVFHSIASLPTAIPGKYYAANEQDIAGGALSFLADFLFPRDGSFGEPPFNPYPMLDDLAGKSPAGSNGVLVTPWLNGERTPVDDTKIRGGIYNISTTTTRPDIVRAFFEGVAFNTRWSLKYVEKFCGRRLDPINIVGGGAKSALWCQVFADVLDRTIRQVKDPIHANARGAAFIAAAGMGYITFDEIPGLVEIENEFKPNHANRAVYETMFNEFLALFKACRPIFWRLNG
jgi:xylulokinase